MKVLKFGGTSVGSAQRIKNVAKLINNGDQNLVVLSAMSGTTNSLIEISKRYYKQNQKEAFEIIDLLEAKYHEVIEELYVIESFKSQGKKTLDSKFSFLRSFAENIFSVSDEKAILAQGELISTSLMYIYLQEQNISSALIPALDFMRIDQDEEPDTQYIHSHIQPLLAQNKESKIIITQGFVCRNAFGHIDNLQRGGSDYSASLIGAAIQAEEIQIWTDIDGMHNNDPRFVEHTEPVRFLSFDEAAELAYFGAKILHPTSVVPARMAQIPVRLLNTLDPEAHGTLISNTTERSKIKAVAAKDGITAIKIKSGHMLLAYGFLRRIFEIFESYKTPIDMVCTSEVAVSLTIDKNVHINEIVDDLKDYGTVTIDNDQVIICVVGDFSIENTGFVSKITDALKDIPVRMISYGGSMYNITVVVNSNDKNRALNALSHHLFNNEN